MPFNSGLATKDGGASAREASFPEHSCGPPIRCGHNCVRACSWCQSPLAALAAASTCLHASDAIGEELFRQAARFKTKHVYYQPSLYTNPYQQDAGTVSAIKESFSRSRDTHVRLLKKRRLEERDEQSQEESTKPKAKARRAAKSRAAPKRAIRMARHAEP